MRDNLRDKAAALGRDIHAMWPSLKGEWSHREWNQQVRIAMRTYLRNMRQFFAVNGD